MYRHKRRESFALAIFLIIVGLISILPSKADAGSDIIYLYPVPQNNPVQQSGLFWLEGYPDRGAFPLSEWGDAIPKDRQIVIGIPENMQMGASMVGDKLGRFIVNKIGKRGKDAKQTPAKDIIYYDRTINREGIKEQIRIEIGEHFKDNDNFKQYIEIMKDSLTNPEELHKIPAPPDGTHQASNLFGNTLIMGGAALLLRILLLAAL